MNLENKRAIVTGSTKGIGLAIAQALVKEGSNVVISSRHQQDIQETVDRLNQLGKGKASGKQCDVREAEQVQDLIRHCVQTFGGVDILINNAGIGIFSSVEELSLQQWRETLATNLDGVFYGCHFAIPEMKKNGGGFIINIGSLAGKNAFPGGAAYNASKFALVGFSEALMQEVRYDDIHVAYVMPGSVETEFSRTPARGEDSWKVSAHDVAEVVIQTLEHHSRCLTSRIEIRPSKPPRKGG
ncbi:SDR family oxidoreductase [Acidobacteria bacterium AH-259-D05]|nr:SDR family oxidoreductase [Acidobacteria bacterium AH-259-D05]